MTEDAKLEVIDGVTIHSGKIYLRDTRSGRVHQYEESLSQMSFIERFVGGEEQTVNVSGMVLPASMSVQDRAAAWDAAASQSPARMPTAEELEQAEKDRFAQEAALAAAQGSTTPKQYVATDKGKEVDLNEMVKQGWTREQLVAEGYVVEAS